MSGRSLQDVGDEYRVSRERIRQITYKVKRHTLMYIERNGEGFEPSVARALLDQGVGTREARDLVDLWLNFLGRFQSSSVDGLI